MAIPLTPGSDVVVAQGEAEVAGPLVDAFGRVLRQLLKIAFALAVLVVHFWSTGWLAGRAGFRYEINGIWPALGGTAIFNVVYVALGTLTIRAEREPEPAPGSTGTA